MYSIHKEGLNLTLSTRGPCLDVKYTVYLRQRLTSKYGPYIERINNGRYSNEAERAN